jgi:hypothetical protein
MTQQSCTARTCFNVPPAVFVPPPKVPRPVSLGLSSCGFLFGCIVIAVFLSTSPWRCHQVTGTMVRIEPRVTPLAPGECAIALTALVRTRVLHCASVW